ncbi:MAG: peptidylprolyl isomerase [Bryobacteraceae bacterium]
MAFALSAWAQSSSQQAPGAPSPEPVQKPKAAAQGAATSGQPASAPRTDNRRVQTITIPAATVVPIMALPPDTLIGTVNGQKVTAGELQVILRSMPPQVQQQAQADRRRFVEQYGTLRQLAEEARKVKLDQQSPWREQIEYAIMQTLYQAMITHKFGEISIPVEEVRAAYEASKDTRLQARVKSIYLAFSTTPVSQPDSRGERLLSEAEAKAKAEDLVRQARSGADFVALVKKHSNDPTSVAKDGDLGFIRKSDQIPAELSNAIFSAKVGEIVGPVRQPNGFYIFRIEEIGPQPFEQVQAAITNDLKSKRLGEWVNTVQKSLDVQVELPPSGVTLTPAQPGAPGQPATPAPPAPPAAPAPK